MVRTRRRHDGAGTSYGDHLPGPALQKALADNLDLALVRQAADLFYYTGTLVDGFLALAPQGSPSWCAGPSTGTTSAPPPGPGFL